VKRRGGRLEVKAGRLRQHFKVSLTILEDGGHCQDFPYQGMKIEAGIMLGKTGSVWTR
jgi:hypothetical protein